MSTEQNTAIHQLLSAWRNHQDNRAAGLSIAELHSSRVRLDEARSSSHLAIR